jgi:hypothetical protein
MGMTEKEFCDAVHLNIHSVRLLDKYVPTNFEKKISKLVLEKYSPTCKECKEIDEKLKANPTQDKPSLLKKIGNAINNAP